MGASASSSNKRGYSLGKSLLVPTANLAAHKRWSPYEKATVESHSVVSLNFDSGRAPVTLELKFEVLASHQSVRFSVYCTDMSPREDAVVVETKSFLTSLVTETSDFSLGKVLNDKDTLEDKEHEIRAESLPLLMARKKHPCVSKPGLKQQLDNLEFEASVHFVHDDIAAGDVGPGLLGKVGQGNRDDCVQGLLLSMQEAKDNANLHDFELHCQGKVYHCNKFVLAARSEVLRAMFSHSDIKECQESKMVVKDASPEALEVFLQMLYTGQSWNLAKNARKVYSLADKYQVTSVKRSCLASMEAGLSVTNAAETAILANLHGEEGFENKVLSFIMDNLDEVHKTASWRTLEKEHSQIVTKLLLLKMKEDVRKK